MASDAGEASAMHCIGIIYQEGHGVEKDYYEALHWYRMASNAGHANSMLSINALYRNGHVVKKWHLKARSVLCISLAVVICSVVFDFFK